MNILIISPSLNPKENVSGISSVVKTFIKNGSCNYIHYVFGSTDQEKENKNIHWLRQITKAFYGYIKLLRKQKIDLVHMNVPCDTKGILREYIIFRINKFYGLKSIIHLHGGEYLMKKPSSKILASLLKKMLKKSNKVIVLSDIEKEKLNELYGYDKSFVLYNCIEIPLTYKKFDKKDNEEIRILFLGRIHESKGVEDIIAAFSKLYPEYPFKFTLCGTGPLKDILIDSCNKLMKDDFSYEGIVFGEKKTEVILNSDIFILPSRYGEGLPMALLETMSMGLVPVVTNDASMKYIIDNNNNGLFVEKQDPNDIYRKIKGLFLDRERMSSISKNARRTIEEKYNIKHSIKTLESIYKECIFKP